MRGDADAVAPFGLRAIELGIGPRTLLAVLVLGERVSALSWLGIALVIAATAVAVVAPKLLEKRQAA